MNLQGGLIPRSGRTLSFFKSSACQGSKQVFRPCGAAHDSRHSKKKVQGMVAQCSTFFGLLFLFPFALVCISPPACAAGPSVPKPPFCWAGPGFRPRFHATLVKRSLSDCPLCTSLSSCTTRKTVFVSMWLQYGLPLQQFLIEVVLDTFEARFSTEQIKEKSGSAEHAKCAPNTTTRFLRELANSFQHFLCFFNTGRRTQ